MVKFLAQFQVSGIKSPVPPAQSSVEIQRCNGGDCDCHCDGTNCNCS
jgi:hypothetical protein